MTIPMSKNVMNAIRVFLIFFGMLFSGPIAFGQFYELSRYADDSGLPSRIVRDMYQDSEGFLWVAGNNGLFKFDGQKFVSFYASLKDTVGLRDNRIHAILETSDNRMWIGTPKGLHVLEDERIRYVSISDSLSEGSEFISSLLEDNNENLWIGSYSGLFVLNKTSGDITALSGEEVHMIPTGGIGGMAMDSKGRLWIGHKKGIFLQRNTNFEFESIPLVWNDGLSLEDTNIFRVLEHDDGFFLIESSKGILKGEWNEGQFIIRKFFDKQGAPVADHFIYHSIVDSKGDLWTATWRNYVKKYRIQDGNLEEEEIVTRSGWKDMASHVISVYEDRQKNIWVANANGLYRFNEDHGKLFVFPPGEARSCLEDIFSVMSMTEDAAGNLWIVTVKGLYRIHKSDVLNRKCPTDYLFIPSPHFRTGRNILIDSQNRLWISALGGLSISQLDADFNPGPFVHYTDQDVLPHSWCFEVFEENPESFWVGNYRGLLNIRFQGGDIANPQVKVVEPDDSRDDALVNSWTLQMTNDRSGGLWVGTYHGLGRLISPEDDGTFENYINVFGDSTQLSNNSIKRVFRDSRDRLWIGTQRGLNLYRENSNDFKQFGREEGLPSEYVLGIMEDREGSLWIATTSGVVKAIYDEASNTLADRKYYTSRDGLADNITNKNALWIDEENNVYIGSSKGLSVLSDLGPIPKNRDFNLALTSIESTLRKEQGFVSVKDRLNEDKITLSHFENSIRLSYAALDFSDPEYNRYRHKFLPISESWIETEALSELTYYNLPPGEYELILDGSNNQGVWAQQPIHLKIRIKPPFWKSHVAFILYALLLTGLIRYMYLVRLRKKVRELEHEAKLEKALVEEREQLRKENTADFHDELGSKVTKISLFLTLAERSLKDKKDPSEWFGKIRNNIKDLSGSFRDLLWVIDPQKDSLSDTFLRLKDFGEDLFGTTEIDFRTTGYHADKINAMLDPQTKKQVVMIFKEAMNNCLKYANCSRVVLKIASNGEYSAMELMDDGGGFNVQQKSKGRGLQNMKDRARKIGADLTILSSEKGTSVRLDRIPHTSDDYQAKEA